MSATVRNKVAIIAPQGFIDGNNITSFVTSEELRYLMDSEVNAIFFSLKHVAYFSITAVRYLSDLFIRVVIPKNSITVGFCDYNEKQFLTLMRFFDQEPVVTLLASRMHVDMLYGGVCKPMQVAHLWHPNPSQRGLLLFSLIQRGFNPITAKSEADLPIVDQEITPLWINFHIGTTNDSIKNYTRNNIVVYIFSHFLDSERVETFDMTPHMHYMKAGFSLFALDCSTVLGINTHALSFFKKLLERTIEYGGMMYIVGLDPSKVTQSTIADLENAGFKFKPTLEELFTDPEIIPSKTNGKTYESGKLTKQTIASLSILVDSTLQTIETMTHQPSKKLSVSMKKANFAELQGEYIGASIAFFGQIEGIIALVFDKKIATKGASVLLGDDDLSDDDVIDSLGELVNITMGKAKTSLSNVNTTIKMTLPRTFASLEEIVENFDHKDGVVITFTFGEDTFIFFLTI